MGDTARDLKEARIGGDALAQRLCGFRMHKIRDSTMLSRRHRDGRGLFFLRQGPRLVASALSIALQPGDGHTKHFKRLGRL
jgi:hypothetical protein